MTHFIENESTKASPISASIAEKILADFIDLYWPSGKERTVENEKLFTLDIPPSLLIRYTCWWVRGNGHPAPDHQVVRGWSKLRLRSDGYTPTEDDVERIKSRGATA